MERYPDVYAMISPEVTPVNRWMAYGPLPDMILGLLILVILWGLPERHKVPYTKAAFATVFIHFIVPLVVHDLGYVPGPLLYLVAPVVGLAVFLATRKKSSTERAKAHRRTLFFMTAMVCCALPMIHTAGPSYARHGGHYLTGKMMDDSILRLMSSTYDLRDFTGIDREVIWYEADQSQDLRDIWRTVSFDLGRVAWNMFGDGPDAEPTDRRVWNAAYVIPERFASEGPENKHFGVLCEYRDGKLDRSNWLLANRTSLGDRPETAPLHTLCPATFNPDNEPLTPAWKFMRDWS